MRSTSPQEAPEKYQNVFMTGSRGRVGRGILPLLQRTFQVVELTPTSNILTNDMTSCRNKVVKTYYHRFEIEETFRDGKTYLGT